jgi:hypothetical protein
LAASLLSGLGLLALVLAVIGIHRAAHARKSASGRLGAQAPDVLAMILRHAGILLGTGLANGWEAVAIVTRYAARILSGIDPTYPWTFAVVASVLAVTATIAR